MRGVQNGRRGIALLDESGILITKSSSSTHIACVQNRFLIITPKIKIEKNYCIMVAGFRTFRN